MFIVEVGSVWTTILAIANPTVFAWSITVWLWLTVIFANLAEAVAEGRGKAQAATLRRSRQDDDGAPGDRMEAGAAPADLSEEEVPAAALRQNDVVVVEAGQGIPGDGDVVEGIASVDESAITGESAPVIRESGGDRSAVTGGTKVLSDRIVVKITQKPGESFIDRMIALVEGANRQKTPNEIALNILLAALTIVFLLSVATLQPLAIFSKAQQPAAPNTEALTADGVTGIVLISLLVCLIPTTIGALLSAIGIAGMDRLVQRNVLAMSGRAVEAAGDVNTLLLDKTGTITLGNRQAVRARARRRRRRCRAGRRRPALEPGRRDAGGPVRRRPGQGAVRTARAPPGRAGRRDLGAVQRADPDVRRRPRTTDHPDTAERTGHAQGPQGRGHRRDRLGPRERRARPPPASARSSTASAPPGGTPLVVASQRPGEPARVLGVIHLKDVVKAGMRQRFDEMRRMGIRTVMITGDNPLTARAIADEAGVDDFLAEATPEDKMALIKKEQEGGKLVAMTGDGTNDAPALAQADVGVAMNTGTSAAKEAGNMVDLDSDPTKLIEIVEIGKQLLITRGALTTFSIANDIAKYFAIIPAMFAAVYPGLDSLNIMRLHSPTTAILAAVIFNALIIIALVPLALRGVRYTPSSAGSMLRRNLLIYGVGGIIAPFVGIKIIDLVLTVIPGIS